MIHEEEQDLPINFTWFYFIGKVKFHMSFKEVGRLTLTTFNSLYQCYKDDFDLEMRLKASNTTYAEAFAKSQQDDEWF